MRQEMPYSQLLRQKMWHIWICVMYRILVCTVSFDLSASWSTTDEMFCLHVRLWMNLAILEYLQFLSSFGKCKVASKYPKTGLTTLYLFLFRLFLSFSNLCLASHAGKAIECIIIWCELVFASNVTRGNQNVAEDELCHNFSGLELYNCG